ncbi:hypothetical protein NUM_69410 [Actinocatenispora comari]|uniref:Uncharacterized protein n=1 Tax=Actinocatenispora comari TaxID=2807577 RepID=A0A8J4ENP1_9ACTN|nr:hypothetical protein NUM_69410 [Actinocatenispora comari]
MRGEGFAPSSRSFPAKGAAPLAIPAQPPVLLPIDAEQQTKKNGAPARPTHHGHARVARVASHRGQLVVGAG